MTAFAARRWLSRLGQMPDAGAIVGVVVVCLFFSLIDFGGWWSFFTQKNVTQYSAILGLVALGETFVIMTGEIDLSVGSIYGLTAIAFITFAGAFGVPAAFLLSMGIAAIAGLCNAFLVVHLRLVSMIATVSMLFIGRGIIYVWTGGSADSLSRADRVHWLTTFFGGQWFGLKNGFFLFAIVVIVAQFLLHSTRLGNHLLATGGDLATAHSRGIRVRRTKTIAYLLSALLSGLSGIITICDQPQTHVTLGEQMELEAIAAAVLGGALLTGGRGSLLGAALGAFILTAVRYELISVGAPSSWYITFLGIIVIVAVMINQKLSDLLKFR